MFPSINPRHLVILPTLCCHVALVTNSSAAVTAIATQQGADVVITATGSFLTDGFELFTVTPTTIRAVISPQLGGIGFGSVAGADSLHYRLTVAQMGPYGTGGGRFADQSSGSVFGIGSSSGMAELAVPVGYLSGSSLSGEMVFQNSTFDSLGLARGTFSFSYSVGAQSDSFTLTVIPESSTCSLIALAGIVVVGARRR